MKKKLLLILLPLLAVTFNSCSMEEGEGLEWDGNTKLVKRIVLGRQIYEWEEVHEYFYDDNQRVTREDMSISYKGEGGYWRYDLSSAYYIYESNRVIVVNDKGEEMGMAILDNNNNVVESYLKNERGEYFLPQQYPEEFIIPEFSNGYMTKFWFVLFTWESGNLIRAHSGDDDVTLEYGKTENKLNSAKYPFYPIGNFAGYGKLPKNLPTYIANKNSYSYNGYAWRGHLSYTFDSDGYPTQVYFKSSDPTADDGIIFSFTYYEPRSKSLIW